MTIELPTYPSEKIAGFREAVASLVLDGVVPKLRLRSSTYRVGHEDGTFGELYRTRHYAVIVWHHEEDGGEIDESAVEYWLPERLVPYVRLLFALGAQEYEPDETPYTGETPFTLRLELDIFAVRCDRWTAPIFGEPLDVIDECVQIMNKKGHMVCQC